MTGLQVLPVWELELLKPCAEGAHAIATEKVKHDPIYQEKRGILQGPAEDLPASVVTKIRTLAKRISHTLELDGYCRIDFRLSKDNVPYFIEANPNPEIAASQEYAQAALHAGTSYGDLLNRIVMLGLKRARGARGSTARVVVDGFGLAHQHLVDAAAVHIHRLRTASGGRSALSPSLGSVPQQVHHEAADSRDSLRRSSSPRTPTSCSNSSTGVIPSIKPAAVVTQDGRGTGLRLPLRAASPAMASRRSAAVTIPSTPPYSSDTMTMRTALPRIASSRFRTGIVSGTKAALCITALDVDRARAREMAQAAPWSGPRRRSGPHRHCATGKREWPLSVISLSISSRGVSGSSQTISVRGVMIDFTERSPRRITLWIMSRSSSSMTPAFSPSTIREWSSSSVTSS
jgi:hypothetical protein